MRHTAHRHGIAALFVSRCQRNLQLARADDGVFKEQFIKITQTKEEQRPGMLRFQFPILANHWSGVTSSHACASEKSAIKNRPYFLGLRERRSLHGKQGRCKHVSS